MHQFHKIILVLCLVLLVSVLGCKRANGDNIEVGSETFEQWKEMVEQTAGPESEAAKTVADCGAALENTAASCSSHDGWSVVNAMEITASNTGKAYQFQDVRNGGCERREPQHVETGTIITQDDQSSSYQVSCNLVCVWWDCEDSDDSIDKDDLPKFGDGEGDNGDKESDGEDEEDPEDDNTEDRSTEETASSQPETWSGTITAKLDDLGTSCSGADVAVDYTFTLHSPHSLVAALEGKQEITLWSTPSYEETSGTIQGTATILEQPPQDSVIYCELEGGSATVPLRFYATGDEQVIQLSEAAGEKNIRNKQFGKEYYYHEEAGLTDEIFLAGYPPLLQATSLSETAIFGVLKEGYGFTGTF